MKSLVLALLLALAVTPEVRYFQFQRPIRNAPQAPTQSCLALDPDIFAHAAPDLADLRLYRAQSEIPWALRTAAPVATVQQPIPPLNLGRLNGQTVFDAAMPDGNFSDVNLSIPTHNFLATVRVSGSNQQSAEASTEIGSYTVFDLTNQKLGRSTVLHLPESNFRFLHFRVDGPLLPENITGLSVERVSTIQPRYLTVAESSATTQKGHTTVIEITVPANTPVDRIVFNPGLTPTAFSRDIIITSTPVTPATSQTNPSTITAAGNLLRLHRNQNGHRIDEERLTLNTPPSSFHPSEKWTIQIENGDDPPIALQSVRLEMFQRDLCFESAGSGEYALMYGDPALTAPQYDYQRLFEAQPNPVIVTASPEQPNPSYQPRPDSRPFTERHPALLWATLIAVIAILSSIAYRTAKHTAPS